ncbi:hypothetical protein [Modicisalibacter zincidurans]|nr:hypothetical protein [Halomonas zincidurans]
MKVRAYYWHHGVMPKWKIKIRDVVRRDGFKYFETGNAGDILNRNIIESKYNASPVNISQEGRRLLMIGSVSHRVKDGDVICGVGTQGKADDIEKKSDVKIFGLRGPITYDEFKEKGYDVSNVSFLMDPGLLVRFMYSDESIQPEKGKVIFIPHYKERRYYRALRRFMWIWPDPAGSPPGCQSDRSW